MKDVKVVWLTYESTSRAVAKLSKLLISGWIMEVAGGAKQDSFVILVRECQE